MKIRSLPKAKTEVERGGREAVIRHHQTIRQSLNYQSAEASVGIELRVEDSDRAIKKGISRAEKLVENALVVKYKDQERLLKSLAKVSV